MRYFNPGERTLHRQIRTVLESIPDVEDARLFETVLDDVRSIAVTAPVQEFRVMLSNMIDEPYHEDSDDYVGPTMEVP